MLLAGTLLLGHLPASAGIPCPLRSLTGIPCPFCGLTTALRDFGGGHLDRSVGAAPLGIFVVAVAVLILLGGLPRRMSLAIWAIVPVLGAEWAFELTRFHTW